MDPVAALDAATFHALHTDYSRWLDRHCNGVGAYLDWADKCSSCATHQAKAIAAPQACPSHEAEAKADATPAPDTRSHATDQAHAAAGDTAHTGTAAATRSNARRRAWCAAWTWPSAQLGRVAAATDANGPWPTRRTAGPADFFAAAHTQRASAWSNTGRSATARARARSVTTPDRDS